MKDRSLKIFIFVLLAICVHFAVYIGIVDGLRHGHFYEEYDYSQISEKDWLGNISLENTTYRMEFQPIKNYLNGFSIFLNNPEDNEGELILTVSDENDRIIDHIVIDLSKVHSRTWYKTIIDKTLEKDKKYNLQFSAVNCKYYPCLQSVNSDYLPDETISGNILLAYSYAQPTFNLQERIMIVVLLFSLTLFLMGLFFTTKKKLYNLCALFFCLTIILAWNFMHNSIDNNNTMFTDFQSDSETLVSSVIKADYADEYFRNSEEYGYGLGRYYDLKGIVRSYEKKYISDDNWDEGYSRTDARIIVDSNVYTKEISVIGNIVRFPNGEEFSICSVNDNDVNIEIDLKNDCKLIPLKYGSLDNVTFFNSNHVELHKGKLISYKSQYGLQGKIFKYLSRYMEKEEVFNNLYLICCIITAIVFVLITYIVSYKYNAILGGCFYVTFWLSPWITNFARNLYWVEFTWFTPMLIGVFCAWKIENFRYRVLCYFLGFLAILLKCLCGYEYISAVLMGLISFMLVDAVKAACEHNKGKFILLFRTIVIIGFVALAGFVLAIVIHAQLRGNGDILDGIKEIVKKDVLRRTSGADLNHFDAVYWPSLNASVWETYSQYFKFETQVITGVSGNMFPLLCIIPLTIFGFDLKNKQLNIETPIMYVVYFLTSISWFCLAKGHSYIHTHINYVLWYFGFIQICLYTIAEKIVKLYQLLLK